MRDDDLEDEARDVGEPAFDVIEGGVQFGDYSVVGPGVQIVLGGRPISHPGE